MRKVDKTLSLKPRDGAITYLVSLAVALIISALSALIEDANARIYLSYLASQIAFISIGGAMLFVKRASFTAIVPLRKINIAGLLLVIPVTIGVFMQNTLIATAFSWLLDVMGVEAEVTVPEVNGVGGILLVTLVICVLPAIGEEFMFRGIMLTSLEGSGVGKAIWLSAIVFALSHFNPAQIVHQFLLGAILAYITVATGNIIYACAVHFLNNVMALFMGNLIPAYNNLATVGAKNALIMAAMCVVGAMILYPSIYALVRVAGKDKYRGKGGYKLPLAEKSVAEQDERKKPDFVFVGFMIFLVAMSVLSAVTSWVPKQ